MSMILPREVVEECMVEERLSPSDVSDNIAKARLETDIDQSAPLRTMNEVKATIPNRQTGQPK